MIHSGFLRRLRYIGSTRSGVRARYEARRIARAGAAVTEAPPHLYVPLLRSLGSSSSSVLDVGTGVMRSLSLFSAAVKIGLDVHRPYLEHREETDAVPLNADARRLGELFIPRSIDLVTLIDVIEHFERDEGERLLQEAELIARVRVVVTTPRGWFPQGEHDAFNLHGEKYQTHRSGWDVEDFVARGYRVAILKAFHDHRNESFVRTFGADAPPVDALVAWKDTSTRAAPED